MTKVKFLISTLIVLANTLLAQKPLLDINEKAWRCFSQYLISNDGEYVAYDVNQVSRWNVYIASVSESWKMNVPNAELVAFTQDSKMVVLRRGDSIGIVDVRVPTQIVFWINAQSSSVVKKGNDSDLLIYKSKDFPNRLVIRHIEGGEEEFYVSTKHYWVSNDGQIIILERELEKNGTFHVELEWLDLNKSSRKLIWSGKKVEDVLIGRHDSALVFSGASADDTANNSIWIYKNATGMAERIIDNHDTLLGRLAVREINVFNDISNLVFVTIGDSEVKKPVADRTLASVDVWNYKDPIMQAGQLSGLADGSGNHVYFKAVFNLGEHHLMRLENPGEKLSSELYTDKGMKYVLLVKSGVGDQHEYNWNKHTSKSVYLVNLTDGSRLVLADKIADMGYLRYILSYNENYVFYYDQAKRNYCSYSVADGKRTQMAAGPNVHWGMQDKSDEPVGCYTSYPFAAVIKDEDAVLAYDQNDIFEFDPTRNGQVAKNLTKKIRNLSESVFRILPNAEGFAIGSHQKVCVSVFNKETKDECVTSLCLEPAASVGSLNFVPYNFNFATVIKARDKQVYVLAQMSVEKAPNLVYTKDFKHYKDLSDIHPELEYNWMTSELVTWSNFSGVRCQGILYKPENFNPSKRYPLLVNYYEQVSDDLHRFLYPGLSDGSLNIPYYVSHGFLVFEPDIHYQIGWPGKSAYNCVVSGVQFLKHYPYVDGKHIGLQGHSFGGFETNYIIAHSKLFAAAMSASAVSDCISGYGSISKNGDNRQEKYELRQSRIGTTLWQNRSLYIENSPVLCADKVVTPLLLLADQDDVIVPVQQGVELFNDLRRLGKRVWMLQYDGEGHNVVNTAAQFDLTLRMAQFFNYFLKDEKPALWMTRGVPAGLKGVESGLELDQSGAKP